MRVLVLAPDAPFPPVTGGQLRIFHLLRALAVRHELTLVAFSWGAPAGPAPFPVRVVEVPWEMPQAYREMAGEDAAAARSAFEKLAKETDEPFIVSYYASPALEATLRRVTREPFDLVLLENTFMARFLPALPADVPRVLVLHNVLALLSRRQAEAATSEEERVRADPERTFRFERRAASQCALCVTVSGQEATAARDLLGVDHVEVVPNGVDTTFFTPGGGPGRDGYLLFTGSMNYWPNQEAVRYFTKEVLPLIRRALPGTTFHVVGTSPGEEIRRLACDHVVVHGAVPDMRPYFRDAGLVVVPLLSGGGTRLKILEAAACGKAIVSTSVGAEGLEFLPGRDLVIADSAAEFAGAVVRLAADGEGRRRLGACARQAALPYDWERIGSRLCTLLEGVCERRGGAGQ